MNTDFGWAKDKCEEAFLPPDHLFVLLKKNIWMLTINQRELKKHFKIFSVPISLLHLSRTVGDSVVLIKPCSSKAKEMTIALSGAVTKNAEIS